MACIKNIAKQPRKNPAKFIQAVWGHKEIKTNLNYEKILIIGLAISGLVISGIALTGCNVTRKVTTQSEYVQRGDTSVVIMTKTIESYDASKKGL